MKQPIHLRRAVCEEAPALTALIHASSAYTGKYRAIVEGYAVTEDQIGRDLMFVAETDDGVIGFYRLVVRGEPELDPMFVADKVQGTGVGKLLFEHAFQHGIVSVEIVSHPASVDFYKRMARGRMA